MILIVEYKWDLLFNREPGSLASLAGNKLDQRAAAVRISTPFR